MKLNLTELIRGFNKEGTVMKKSIFLMIAAVAATVISCSKENSEPQLVVPEG